MARAVAVAATIVCMLSLGVASAGSHGAAAPVIDGWNISAGDAGCGCLDVNIVLTSNVPTVIRAEWGTTSALGSQAGSGGVPIGTKVGFTLKWAPRPDPGSYYVRLVADSQDGSFTTETDTMTLGADGSVRTAPPPFPPRPPDPPGPRVSATVSPTTPVTIVVGDTADFSARVMTNAVWSSTSTVGVSFTLPGEIGACTGRCIPTAVEVVSATMSLGTSCTSLVICSFGLVGANADVTATLRLRAKLPGQYNLVVQPDYSLSVTIPVSIVPRVADLAVAPVPAVAGLKLARRVVRTVTVANNGPHSVPDAVLVVGSPRLVSVHAAVGGVPCSPAPIRCPLGPLATGQSAAVSITLIGKRAGRTTIPVGVASQAAGDPVTTNNTAPIAIRVVQPRRHTAR